MEMAFPNGKEANCIMTDTRSEDEKGIELVKVAVWGRERVVTQSCS